VSKRFIDIAGAATFLALTSPVLAITALIVLIAMGRPVLFRQVRPGLNERPFTLLKLRTMRNGVGSHIRIAADAERLTALGCFLRRSSLDEMPQLWNVLRGSMSLVGPRPLLDSYLPLYSAAQRRRHEVKPGITGWAQINGRNTLTWERKFELDVWYVDNWSLQLDMKILLHTAWKVLRREAIAQEGHATMPEFLGSRGRKQSA
jgi:lipopolysaccharide/colanic/teichoic acid biosynthesis glycosyltransferase